MNAQSTCSSLQEELRKILAETPRHRVGISKFAAQIADFEKRFYDQLDVALWPSGGDENGTPLTVINTSPARCNRGES